MPDLMAIDLKKQSWLEEAVKNEKQNCPIPAISACIVSNGHIVAQVVTGERKWESGIKVVENDAFNIGSVSKTVTATLTAVMIEEGMLGWDTKIVDVFPELVPEGNPYRDVTVLQLLAHIGGLSPTPAKGDTDKHFTDITLDYKKRCYYFARAILQEPSASLPGTEFHYSQGGSVVTAMLIKLTGLTYEELLQRYIAGPLGFTNTCSNVTPEAKDDPEVKYVWQHRLENSKMLVLSPVGWKWPADIGAPLGGINMCITDQAKYMIAHMPNGLGPRLLRNDTLNVLHTPAILNSAPGEDECPGFGASRDKMWTAIMPVLHHSGSNGANYTEMAIAPNVSCGFSMCENAMSESNTPGFVGLEQRLFLALNDFVK
jgi:CubicO group peptidase (beta-lactamase class C family)